MTLSCISLVNETSSIEEYTMRKHALAIKASLLLSLLTLAPFGQAQTNLGIARYSEETELLFPPRTDEWIHMGSSLGGEYGDKPFDPNDPGTLGVVTMEPEAYRYFKEHGEYAGGTMFLLSFYHAEAKSDPQLPGYVQGELQAKEIHVIDDQRFAEGRAFYLYSASDPAGTPSNKVPDGSACIKCHLPEGDYDGTFIQFYPAIRDLPRN